MSIDTGRTELTFAGRASHAGTPCPSNVSDPMALATALAPKPNFTKSRRPRLCRSVLFMSHSLKVTTVYYSSLDGRNAFCYVLTQQQRYRNEDSSYDPGFAIHVRSGLRPMDEGSRS